MVEIKLPYRSYPRVQVDFPLPSMTQQYFREEADINKIIANNPDISQVQYVNKAKAFFADVSDYGDYYSALDKVEKAEEAFMNLPATLRNRFDNDPGLFLDFVSDPKNLDEMIELGIAEREAPKSPANEPKSPLGDSPPN